MSAMHCGLHSGQDAVWFKYGCNDTATHFDLATYLDMRYVALLGNEIYQASSSSMYLDPYSQISMDLPAGALVAV